MNTIRNAFRREIKELLPVLHRTYRCIGVFQKNRTARNAERLLRELDAVAPLLAVFRPHVQAPKRAYFDALASRSLGISDRIVALDIAVGMMHIEFRVQRAYAHRESPELKKALAGDRTDGVLVRGIQASPGRAIGEAFVMAGHHRSLAAPPGAILVATALRPELVLEMRRVAGIVTDTGGALCHAAVVARELNLPCVTGTGDATSRIETGWWVCLDGTVGEIRRL